MIEQFKRSKLVGDFIKKHREAKGLSQRALGMLFEPHVTTQFISNVERGVTPLPPAHIPILAKALAVSDSEIMALLEREYANKLNGKLGKPGDVNGSSVEGMEQGIRLSVTRGDYDFMKTIYEAYQSADPKTKQAFAAVCENVLQVSKSGQSQK